jgi:hypothetical protein
MLETHRSWTVSVDIRCATVAALCALSVCIAAPAYAQRAAPAPEQGANAAAPPAPEEGGPGGPDDAQARDAAARDAADRLHGAGDTEESLLGAPAPFDDPYRAAFDSTDQRITKLTNSEQVPRGALHQDVYGGQAPQGRGAPRVPMGIGEQPDGNAPDADKGADAAFADNPGNVATGQGAAPPEPEDAAQAIYHGAGSAKAANQNKQQQVYRMPW